MILTKHILYDIPRMYYTGLTTVTQIKINANNIAATGCIKLMEST